MERTNHQACKLAHYRIASHKHPVSQIPPTDGSSSAPIDVRRVRRLFSRPPRVAESDFLRREVAQRMHERLALIKIQPQQVLDAGCGEGADLSLLQQYYTGAQVCGIDASPEMLEIARRRQADAASSANRLLSKLLPRLAAQAKGPSLLCADFAQLPLALNSADLVWSNLALHWHPQPDRVFAEWRRVLRVDGLLMFSCFGPDTFKEIRDAFAEIDREPHALPFVDMHDFGDMLVNAGFSTPVMDMETITVTYPSVEKLLDDVRAWGGNPLANRRRGLTGRRAWHRMREVLEKKRRSDGKIPLTFEIIYGHAFRPVPKTTSSGETIIRLDLKKR
jgi:malonyl-CoA O-methyltransferase